LIFAAASAAGGYFALLDNQLSDTQVNIATIAAKRHQQDLFTHDPVFGSSELWRFHTPLNQALLEMVLVPSDYRDLSLPFRAMTGVALMIYLSGMYALLYRQCRSWSISAFVAVLSSAVTYTLGRAYWGLGSLSSITPPALVTAVVPLIVLTYLRYENQWRVMLVFAFVGLCANLHLVSAMNLTGILLIVYLARKRFAPSAWPTAFGGALAALAAALPYTVYYLHLRFWTLPAETAVSASAVYEAFQLGNLAVLYPDMLKSLLYWLLLILVLVIPAAAVLSRIERFRVRDLGVWVWFAVGACFVSLLLHGASQLIGILQRQAPPIIDFAQASCYVMLPLYVLFAQALTNLFRLVRTHRAVLRWVCVAFLAAWMLPSDNLRVARHIAYELGTSFMPEEQKPLRVQQLHTKDRQQAELSAIADWARNHTPTDAMFLFDEAEFRMRSQRAIVASNDDVKFYYYVAPWQLEGWIRRVTRQKALLHPPGKRADGQALAEFVDLLQRQDGFEAVKNWYVILGAREAPNKPDRLQPIDAAGWGKDYFLYKLP